MNTTKTARVTDLNLFCLTEFVVDRLASVSLQADGTLHVPNGIAAVERNGMTRCMRAGLVGFGGSAAVLKLTVEAVEIVKRRVRQTVDANNTFWPERLAMYTAAAVKLGC